MICLCGTVMSCFVHEEESCDFLIVQSCFVRIPYITVYTS